MNKVETLANKLFELLAPKSERLLIAGSIRRIKKNPKDIDFVCVPRLQDGPPDLFGECPLVNVARQWINAQNDYQVHMNGDRMMRFFVDGVKIDLFFADEMNTGYIAVLRTGPRRFSKRLVTSVRKGGFRPDNVLMTNGYVYRRPPNGKPGAGDVIQVETENQLFALLGMGWIAPEVR